MGQYAVVRSIRKKTLGFRRRGLASPATGWAGLLHGPHGLPSRRLAGRQPQPRQVKLALFGAAQVASYQPVEDRRHFLLPELLRNGDREDLSLGSAVSHFDQCDELAAGRGSR